MMEARTLTEGNAEEIASWCGGRAVVQHNAIEYDQTTTGVNVQTPQGVKRAQVGDKVIRYHDGSFQIERQYESGC